MHNVNQIGSVGAQDECTQLPKCRVWLLAVGAMALTISFVGMTLIVAKAVVGQRLLQNAWEQAVVVGTPQRPWPWADFLVTAELRVPELGVRTYVLNNDSGEALAFGPGFSLSNAHDQVQVISGHRDTHFLFLRNLKAGMRIELYSIGQRSPEVFVVQQQAIVDSRRARLPSVAPSSLILVTCYPFDATSPNGPLRYLSIARLQTPKVVGSIML